MTRYRVPLRMRTDRLYLFPRLDALTATYPVSNIGMSLFIEIGWSYFGHLRWMRHATYFVSKSIFLGLIGCPRKR